MLKKIIPAIMVSLFAVSAFAGAQAGAPTLADLDTDKDGVLSQTEAEVAGIGKELFAVADTDMNGTLSEEEYTKLTTGDK